jgi:hypothetical protein
LIFIFFLNFEKNNNRKMFYLEATVQSRMAPTSKECIKIGHAQSTYFFTWYFITWYSIRPARARRARAMHVFPPPKIYEIPRTPPARALCASSEEF